jgi:hypothetical protein
MGDAAMTPPPLPTRLDIAKMLHDAFCLNYHRSLEGKAHGWDGCRDQEQFIVEADALLARLRSGWEGLDETLRNTINDANEELDKRTDAITALRADVRALAAALEGLLDDPLADDRRSELARRRNARNALARPGVRAVREGT